MGLFVVEIGNRQPYMCAMHVVLLNYSWNYEACSCSGKVLSAWQYEWEGMGQEGLGGCTIDNGIPTYIWELYKTQRDTLAVTNVLSKNVSVTTATQY